jgi:hypothetical protein
MRWIALAIAAYVVVYTVVTLRYRKPGPEFQPYEQFRERAGLAKAGFVHLQAKIDRPADPRFEGGGAAVSEVAGGLPEGLRGVLPAGIPLPAEIGKVFAPAVERRGGPYSLQFGCLLPDNRSELGGAEAYLKDGAITIVSDVERLPGGLLTRTRANVILLSLPPGALPPGTYRATLVGERSSKSWSFEVR